ncbi:M23 family metallopeptidase [Cytobacillus firmus]|uniref:M23 family metallopeptidase n=1 Tax=Cytobacillus firmus TaxID=1399 RepID=UPI0018CCC089|nr:M23 family metallopeptidase [Cytobacillus firmus]MED1908601.1 M23 family metallopeptidase [Cytobacillus firmus]MED1943003.1 M23 family metallopeptidase [Cytobacillus firmus]
MKFRLSGEFGELSPVRNWQPHTGIDLAIPENSTLRAIGEGVVDKVFTGEGAIGKGLSIKFPDGTRGIYGHMNEVTAKVGDRVHPGDIIGISGSTGHSTAAHLHFGLRSPDGTFHDPTPLAEQLAAISGNSPDLGILGKLATFGMEGVRGKTADLTTEILLGIFDALKDLLLGVTLVGSAVLIILKVAGWRDGGRWAGILLVTNILIKFLFGVY